MKRPRLLLVGWDFADWSILHPLLDGGDMPTLNRLVETGASCALLSVQPAVTALQWTSLATGKRAWQHGVCHARESIVAPAGATIPISARRRRAAVLWEMLAHEGQRSLAVGWPATHDEQNGATRIVSDRYPEPTAAPGVKPWPPAAAGTYWPREMGAGLDKLRVSPEEVASDIISRYVPLWREVDQTRDRRLGQLRVLLAADFSQQTAAAEMMANQEWEFAAVRFPAVGGISDIFMPFHSLRSGAREGDEFQLYSEVINSHFRMLDLMLRRLLELAGPETAVAVVSARGESSHGIFAAAGPGFARDALLHGASVLDVAPTVLTWFDLPMGDDMEGRVLIESFAAPPAIARVPDWDSRLPVKRQALPETPESLQGGDAAASVRRESEWNYAQSCIEAGRHEDALAALGKLFRAFPERAENSHGLFQCQLALGRLEEAEATLAVVLEALPGGVMSLLPRAELALARRDLRGARVLVEEARQLNSSQPGALRRIGMLLLRLRDWDGLAELAGRALQLDENDALAWLGLAEAQLRKGHAAKAGEAARRAIGLKYFLPEAHFVLTRSLVAEGRWREAHDAMQALLKLQPNHPTAPAYLKRMPSQNRAS